MMIILPNRDRRDELFEFDILIAQSSCINDISLLWSPNHIPSYQRTHLENNLLITTKLWRRNEIESYNTNCPSNIEKNTFIKPFPPSKPKLVPIPSYKQQKNI